MDWGASPSSWTCGFSEYTCTPGNGATDLRDCPAIYEDSIVVAPREMRSESEKRFEALMGEGGGDAAVPVAAVEHLEVGDAAPRATAIAVPDGPPPRAAPRGAFFANVGAMAEDAAAFRAWRDDHFPRQARAPAVVPPDFAAFCRGHDFATRGAYDAFVAAGGWAAYPGAVCAAVELDDVWEVDGGFRVAGRVVVSHYDGRVAAELDSRKLDRVAPAAPPRLALANARPAACDLAAAPGDDDARSPVFERVYALPAGLELAAPGDGAQFPFDVATPALRVALDADRAAGAAAFWLPVGGSLALNARLRGWDVRAPALAVADKVGDRPVLTLRLALSRRWRPHAPAAAALAGASALALLPYAVRPHRVAPRLVAGLLALLAVAAARAAAAARRPPAAARATALDAYGAACLAFAGAACVSHVAVRALPGGARGAADAASLAAFAAAWALGHAAVALRARRRAAAVAAAFGPAWDQAALLAPGAAPPDHVAARARLPPVFPV